MSMALLESFASRKAGEASISKRLISFELVARARFFCCGATFLMIVSRAGYTDSRRPFVVVKMVWMDFVYCQRLVNTTILSNDLHR
jgi:hypothetical protein